MPPGGTLSFSLEGRFQERGNGGLVGALIEWRDSIAQQDGCHR
jgi:hypothetical protein